MKYPSLLLLALAGLLASCSTAGHYARYAHRHPEAVAAQQARRAAPSQRAPLPALAQSVPVAHAALDSAVVVPHRGWLQRALGRPARPYRVSATGAASYGKKSTVNNYYGPTDARTTTVGKRGQQVVGDGASLTSAGKKAAAGDGASSAQKPAAPVASQQGVATDQKKATNAVQHQGDGDAIDQKAETTKPGIWPMLARGLGLLAAIGTIYWLVLGGGAAWLAAAWARRKQNPQS